MNNENPNESFIQQLKHKDGWAWAIVIIFSAVIVLGSFIAYQTISGDNPRDKDTKIYDSVKNDCVKLKTYILNNYDSSFHYNEATSRYGVMCK